MSAAIAGPAMIAISAVLTHKAFFVATRAEISACSKTRPVGALRL
jgi:hypothetical protein